MSKSDSREQLRIALQRALDDAQFRPGKLETLMEQYPMLRGSERGALVHLSNWEADEYLRLQSPQFANYSRNRLSQLLKALY
ncbi:hypothetical protein [Altererythrobacter sp. GH1-8]|uniref:hypothetical protein n=1 Tax=Altererythrobacter sp. GH1-8 TaxID=3349333 RepID=UPI00374CE316